MIRSRENPAFRRLKGIFRGGRESREHGLAVIEGAHLVEASLSAGVVPEMLALSETGCDRAEMAALSERSRCREKLVFADPLFRDLSDLFAPAGILAVIRIPAPPEGPSGDRCVMLDGVQDPGNAGSILRSAAAAGIPEIWFGRGCVAAWSPRVLRSAQGAHFRLRIGENADLAEMTGRFPGRLAATVARGGAPPWEHDLRGNVAWLFGSEGAGLSPALSETAGIRVTLPMAEGTESLNVAATAAICFFESIRQEKGG